MRAPKLPKRTSFWSSWTPYLPELVPMASWQSISLQSRLPHRLFYYEPASLPHKILNTAAVPTISFYKDRTAPSPNQCSIYGVSLIAKRGPEVFLPTKQKHFQVVATCQSGFLLYGTSLNVTITVVSSKITHTAGATVHTWVRMQNDAAKLLQRHNQRFLRTLHLPIRTIYYSGATETQRNISVGSGASLYVCKNKSVLKAENGNM